MLKAGADISKTYKHGKSLVYIASEKNAVNFVVLLVKSGADVDIPTTMWKQTPLFIAAKKGHVQVCSICMYVLSFMKPINSISVRFLYCRL